MPKFIGVNSPPVLFIVFNRPELTKKVLEAILKARPLCIYIAADAARAGNEQDIPLCEKVTEIVKDIPNDQQVKYLFRNENLGCRKAVVSAIDWFFQNEEAGIILEDDCLPSEDFFSFCHQMLEKYRMDERIKFISGDNFVDTGNYPYSYYFTRYSFVWGWASWRRAWHDYVGELDRKSQLFDAFGKIGYAENFKLKRFWLAKFHSVYFEGFNTWDYQLAYSFWSKGGLSICPSKNLVSNIGFGADATHTKNENIMAKLEIKKIGALNHPEEIDLNMFLDHNLNQKIVLRESPSRGLYNTLLYYWIKITG